MCNKVKLFLKNRASFRYDNVSWLTVILTFMTSIQVPEWARYLDIMTDWPSVVLWLWLWLWLTPCSWALLQRSLVVWTHYSFLAVYGTRRFNTEFTRALHLPLSWARPFQSTSPHSTSTRYSLTLTPWSWALLESSLVVSTLDSLPAFHGTRRFNTEFSCAYPEPDQSSPHHPIPPLQDPS
jgi:hypothetical protein